MDEIIEKIKNFLSTEYALAYIIGAVVILVVVVLVVVLSIKSKKKAKSNEPKPVYVKADIEELINSENLDEAQIDAYLDEQEKYEANPEEYQTAVSAPQMKARQAVDTMDILIEVKPIKVKEKPVKFVDESERTEYVEPYILKFDDGDEIDHYSNEYPGEYRIYVDFDNKLRYRVISPTGRLVAHTWDGYDREGLERNMQSVSTICHSAEIIDLTKSEKQHIIAKPVFEIYQDMDAKFRFKLIAANLDVLLHSPGFKTKTACVAAIGSLRNIALNHINEDLVA
ncbi:MAG: DUF1508 domain-containing protein [Christensenellaceae bacterium]|jgi:uncharacterized protein YegP (UPF0339 family)|nr:DUF1508 domain-containing protein [Christensenellaceae bacterium]